MLEAKCRMHYGRKTGGERGTLREFWKRAAFKCFSSETNVYQAQFDFKTVVVTYRGVSLSLEIEGQNWGG